MRPRALPIRLTPEATVRLLLAAVMGLVLAVMLLLSSPQAVAQSAGPQPYGQEPYGLSRDEIVTQLGDNYGEVPVAGGIAANGSVLEVFASPDGLSWTIIVTHRDGTSSVIAAGEGWSFITAIRGLRV